MRSYCTVRTYTRLPYEPFSRTQRTVTVSCAVRVLILYRTYGTSIYYRLRWHTHSQSQFCEVANTVLPFDENSQTTQCCTLHNHLITIDATMIIQHANSSSGAAVAPTVRKPERQLTGSGEPGSGRLGPEPRRSSSPEVPFLP